jgi:hypothetical protein
MVEPRAMQVLLNGLKEALRLEEWEQPQPGVALLPLEGGITIELDGSGEFLVLRAALQERVETGEESTMEAMLLGNLLGQQTGGACLGVDADGAVLWKRLPPGLPVRAVQLELEDFSNYAEVWQKIIREVKERTV